MRGWWGLALLGALAGCASQPPADTVQARCQQQVYNDPGVKALLVQTPNRNMDPQWQWQLEQARHNAVNTCLAANGVAVRGGVQPVSRANYGLGNY